MAKHKTDEQKGQYATETEDSLNNARAMMGWDGPTVEIESPSTVTERRGGKLVEADRPAFVKIYTNFKAEMKDIDSDALKVWLFIALSVNRFSGEAHPGLRAISESVGLAVNTVRAAVERLENDYNLLQVHREDGKSNKYYPADYVSANKDGVSQRDTVPGTVSESSRTVSNSSGTVSSQYRKSAQPEEQELTRKRGDLVDLALLSSDKDKPALDEFERVFGFNSLPWYSNTAWDKFRRFIAKIHAQKPRFFREYVAWRNGDGKYKAFSNRKIRENPQMFMDTGYPEFEASKMYEANAGGRTHLL
jgi:hypothetical protein